MYADHILFIVGGTLLLIAGILAFTLWHSRRRDWEYQKTLLEATERLDVVSTLQNTRRTQMDMNSEATTEQTDFLNSHIEEDSTGTAENNQRVMIQPTEWLDEKNNIIVGDGLDLAILNGKYRLTQEISGGGMSRVFLAQHARLGNEWIVKFVEYTELAEEAEVLKKLNHPGLPRIIDIFQDAQGTFLVESYIEGCSVAEALTLEQHLSESQICDWGLQLAQVLNYLHNLETPIIHCDLKPSNIMVTHDDKLVLIDFGISKRQEITKKNVGLTVKYAAPEQFKGKSRNSAVAQQRFGELPLEQATWEIDERTDLFSVGVILYELATGNIPTADTAVDIYQCVSQKFADAIYTCLQVEPDARFQSAQELINVLEAVKNERLEMARHLVMRKVAVACCAVAFLAGSASTASAAYINRMENLSIVNIDPGKAVVTTQQSVQILMQKVKPNGDTVDMETEKFTWSYSDENIARMDADRLVGLNVGQTTLYGQYRNKIVSLEVTVTEPVQELVDIALRYPESTAVSTYAGSGEREITDGTLTEATFISPEYLSVDDEGVVYVSDSGNIRIIDAEGIYTLPLEPDFLTAEHLRGKDDAVYVLTGPWEAEDGDQYYGFLRITDEGAEFLYYTDAVWSTISDFAFSNDGMLWFIQQNLGTGKTTLNTLNEETYESAWVMDLPDGARRMAFDEADTLYISVPDSGVIVRVGKGETGWNYFAGVEDEKNFIDGAIPNFYRPTALAADGDAVYVLDFDTVRKITVEGKGALFTETICGVPTNDTNPTIQISRGSETTLPASELASIAMESGKLLLSDPKNSKIYAISLTEE